MVMFPMRVVSMSPTWVTMGETWGSVTVLVVVTTSTWQPPWRPEV